MSFDLDFLRDEIRNCKACGLCEAMPFFPVPGIGQVNSSIMIVGEAPGEDEAIAEEPFVGLAGKMLDRLLNQAGITRKSVYIANVVNCRPTEGKKNRPPSRTEIKACSSWLYKQIELVKPKVIFTLGKIPSILLLKEKSTFKLHDHIGIVHKVADLDGIDIIPNLHPSYIMQYGKQEVEQAIDIFKLGHNYI